MSNVASVTTYTSSSGLTTAVVQDFYSETNVPNFNAVKSCVTVSFALETLMNPAGTAVQLNIPLFSAAANSFAPVRVIRECVTPITQTGTSTSTQLTYTLAVATTPATLAITTGTTPANINATGTVRATTLVGVMTNSGSSGVDYLAAGQFQSDDMTLTSTTVNRVLPGQTLYLKFTPSGTLTTSTIYNGVYKFYILGDIMTASTQTI